jgi:hypothetical protein
MKTLAELIADANSSGDLEFTSADGTKFKLSDVRGFRSSVDTETTAARRAREQAENTAKEAQTVFDALKAAQVEFEKRNTPPEPDKKGKRWQDNPLYDELVPVIEAAEKAARESREMAVSLKSSLDTAQATYIAERLKREWAEMAKKPTGVEFKDAVAEVLSNKEVDELGLPTMQKWMHRKTEPDRIAQAVQEGIAAAQKEWEKKQRAADIPKPGRFQTRKGAGEAPIKKLDELTSELVGNDPDIIAAMEGPIS